MKSPRTGKEMSKLTEETSVTFKGRNVKYVQTVYVCDFTGDRFTTTELDEVNLKNIHESYAKLNQVIYIASPYSSPNEKLRIKNYNLVTDFAAKLVSEGKVAISPITYGHTLAEVKTMPLDFDFWENFCFALLAKCNEMVVYKLPGWQESKGVTAEIKFCLDNKIPVTFVDVK